MRILPGLPQATVQAICTGDWADTQHILYVSGSSLVILGGVDTLFQTIYHDVELDGVAFDELSGKIAVASGHTVYVYQPELPVRGTRRKWASLCTFETTKFSTKTQSLSWGQGSELLIAGSCLSLWCLQEDGLPVLTWKEQLANPAQLALLSYDGALIASLGYRDRLVKIWRRQTFGCGEPQFDFTYLPHPQTVTAVHWKKPFHREFSTENVLYTMCKDGILRVWSPIDMHDVHLLNLGAAIDTKANYVSFGSQPVAISDAISDNAKNYTTSDVDGVQELPTIQSLVVLDSNIFTTAIEAAVRSVSLEEDTQNLRRLVEIATRSPELIFVLEGQGGVTVWGMENVGCRSRKTVDVFGIMHQIEKNVMSLLLNQTFLHLLAFNNRTSPTGFNIIAHLFSGDIHLLEVRFNKLLDTSPQDDLLVLSGTWSGHSTPISGLARTADGRSMLSTSPDVGFVVWVPKKTRGQYTLSKQSAMNIVGLRSVQHSILLDNGRFVLTLHESYLILWNTSFAQAHEVAKSGFSICLDWKCFLLLPEPQDDCHMYHVAAIGPSSEGLVWEIVLPTLSSESSKNQENTNVLEIAQFDLGMQKDLSIMLPVDPVGWSFTLSGSLDSFNRDVAISLSSTGLLRSWTAKFSVASSELSWLETAFVETMIPNPSLARGSSIQKVAILNAEGSQLSIWDSRCAQLEFEDVYPNGDVARDLDWTCTPDSQSILAVGFCHQILLLSQLRYDYLQAGPAWAYIRRYDTMQYTPHPIGDSIWLCDGTLVVGIGNQLLVHSKDIDNDCGIHDNISTTPAFSTHQPAPADIFEVVSRLNGPIPIYHPQFLQQCILAGKMSAVHTILEVLLRKLKFSNDIANMDSLLGLDILDLLEPVGAQSKIIDTFTSVGTLDIDDSTNRFDEEMAATFSTLLKDIAIPHLTGSEQMALNSIIACVCQVEEHRRSIDENGARYLLFFNKYSVWKKDPQEKLQGSAMSFRDIVWAFHSDSQEIILALVSKKYESKVIWSQAREAGIFMWLRDLSAVRTCFESLARNQYVQAEEKNPVACSLFYLALRKKNILLGLWRMASWNKEQTTTQRFLANDFREERWRTAALKNAYALLGKQRFEYAAAFFLLADSLKDAVNVCFNQLKDMQLAIAVARVYEGDDGPILIELLEEKVLPLAVHEGNKWLATWAFWMLGKKDKAVRALITPIHVLVDAVESPGQSSRFFLTDDPALAILYRQIRVKSLQTLRGAEKVPQGDEFQFVLHTARLYDRMGCDALALDLVRNWDFLLSGSTTNKSLMEHDPQKLNRRRSSVIVADDTGITDTIGTVGLRQGLTKPPPSVFEEPDMDSFSHFDF